MIIVQVHAGNIEKALSDFKRFLQRERFFISLKKTREHETESEKRARKKQEAARRLRKMARKNAGNG